MRVVVSQDVVGMQGVRTHYCETLRKRMGLRVEGRPEIADVFCPMCGALSPWDRDNHFYDGPSRPHQYRGPVCKHGEPDALCTELVAADDLAAYQLKYTYCVREYPAAALAARHGCAPTVIHWVKYCIQCRQDFARSNLPLLRHELARLHDALAEESRTTQHTLRRIGDDIRGLNGAASELERVAAEAENQPDFSRRGFVYLIGHTSALKIGWTEKHPGNGRLAQLQTSTEKTLELVGYVVGTIEDERALHGRFAKYRIRGEWFQPAQEILAHFQQNQP